MTPRRRTDTTNESDSDTGAVYGRGAVQECGEDGGRGNSDGTTNGTSGDSQRVTIISRPQQPPDEPAQRPSEPTNISLEGDCELRIRAYQ